MAEIILVHGIDQQQKSADMLESNGSRAWLAASVRRGFPMSPIASGVMPAIPEASKPAWPFMGTCS